MKFFNIYIFSIVLFIYNINFAQSTNDWDQKIGVDDSEYEVVLYQNTSKYKDSISVVMSYVKYDTDDYRVVVYSDRISDTFTNIYDYELGTSPIINSLEIFPNKMYIENDLLVIEFDNSKRLNKWERKMFFKPELDIDNEIDWKLIKDEGEIKMFNEKIQKICKTESDFGIVYLSTINFISSSDVFAYNKLKTTIYNFDKQLIINFLDGIEEKKTIYIKKGIYNFSILNYKRKIGQDKYIKVENGELNMVGLSNVNFKAEDETLFITDNDFGIVLHLENCKNINVNNIHAMHDVKEGNCRQEVISIFASDNINFNNCLIDGSGLQGFSINKSNVKISNTIITHCSKTALELDYATIQLENIEISNNNMSVVFYLNNSNIVMESSVIKDNNLRSYFSILIGNSKLKIKNSNIDLKKGIPEKLFEGNKPEFINTKVQLK